MKIRRRSSVPNLRELPLDGVDMFMLSCMDGETSLSQLAELAGLRTEPDEVQRRLRALEEHGLCELTEEDALPAYAPSSGERILSVRMMPTAARSTITDDMVTLRPPPGTTMDPDQRETLRAPPMAAFVENDVGKKADAEAQEADEQDASQAAGSVTPMRPPSPKAWIQAEPSVNLLKLLDLTEEDFDLEDIGQQSKG